MLGFLKRLFSEERLEKLDRNLTTAFERVRSDTSNLFSWVNYLREKDIANDEKHEKINYILGNHHAIIKTLQQEIIELKNELKNQKIAKVSPETDLVRTKSEPKISGKRGARTRFEKSVVRKVMSRRKEYIMEKILELVSKGKYSTSEIEDIVVNERVLCGRTAFYDYLRELRYKRLIKNERSSSKPMLILT